MNAKKVILKVVLYAVFMLLLYFLQAVVFSRLPLFGVKPLFIPVAAVCIGLFEGNLLGGLLGLVCGLLCDFSLSDSKVIFTIFLPAVGFLSGLLCEYILAKGFPSCFLCSVITLLLSAFLQSFKYFAFHSTPLAPIAKVALLQTLYSLFFIIPLYWTVRAISRRTKA